MSGRILLKGAFGFVGSAFWRCLAAQGTPPEVVTVENAQSLDPHGVDLLIDCAGNSKKYLAEQNPQFDLQKNVTEVAESLDRFRPAKYILLSSSAVYADPSSPTTTREVDEPEGEVSIYGQHKRQAEQLARQRVPRPLILRPAGFYGPGLVKGPVLDLLENNAPWVTPDSRMQLLDVDYIAALALQLAREGGTYNAVPPRPIVLSEAFPTETAAQRERWPANAKLGRLDFELDGKRFNQAAGGLGLSERSLAEFADWYVRHERRSSVPVLVLAGGEGTRLAGPTPKPARLLAGRLLVYHAARPFLAAGYTQLVILLGHGANAVGQAIDAEPDLSAARRLVEAAPLGTGGAVLQALGKLECETAIVTNGDTLLNNFDPESLVKHHLRTEADVTLLGATVSDPADFGTLEARPDGRLRAFREKSPGTAAVVYAGVAVVRRRALLPAIPAAGPRSLERDIFAAMAGSHRVQVFAPPNLTFVDAGTPAGWAAAEKLVAERTSCSS